MTKPVDWCTTNPSAPIFPAQFSQSSVIHCYALPQAEINLVTLSTVHGGTYLIDSVWSWTCLLQKQEFCLN